MSQAQPAPCSTVRLASDAFAFHVAEEASIFIAPTTAKGTAMGIFSSIKDAIFGGEAEAQEAPQTTSTPGSGGFGRAEAKGSPISEVDVEARLDAMAGADKLNWRTSIVDLMKLVGLDPSYANRKELAIELGDADYSGKAEENIALHQHVMDKLAETLEMDPVELRRAPFPAADHGDDGAIRPHHDDRRLSARFRTDLPLEDIRQRLFGDFLDLRIEGRLDLDILGLQQV